ncbi:acyl-CoA reductase-like NAD-dependent aldehyde dehydrogenase [Actinopolyspora biskrensis]|uniref:Acyl-CoA reductase-like NAD-dependent aldehyde dehydrogenase n=1 Tax=Actinopolyspora biskrensis TaxID=1470178 RepID=A0A852YU89_9ACTN|nr:aldehyde dehydrogenase family protein [Actinopolyspora biskrensis]NYH77302.1 acyl-CoA reductase-like NAD-dependent aldehyde dehydrogenase [Actinopolyspora biskrensis]
MTGRRGTGTGEAAVDAAVRHVREGEQTWAATSLAERRALLTRMQQLVAEHAQRWVEVAASIKQLSATSPLLGEEWISGPWALSGYLTALGESLDHLAGGASPLTGFSSHRAPGDRVAIDVLPHHVFDRLLLSGFRAEVWLQPGVTVEEARATAGLGLLRPEQTGGVCAVLGAGNIFSIAPLDVLYQLYAENRVVVLKLNPVTDPLKPVFEAVFAPFLELGVMEIMTGGAGTGAALVDHPVVTAVHMTGSEATHDAIVWGTGEAGRAAREAGEPQLAKPVTSELGGVAPVIIVPGRWSKADLRYQARHVATQRLHNSGSNCIATQVVLVSSDWEQKDAFLDELRAALAAAHPRTAWYPGSAERINEARARHERTAEAAADRERALLRGLDLDDPREPAFRTEYFAPVLGVAELPGEGAGFLSAAVTAANTTLRGTLGANIVIHPRTRKELGARLDEAVANLRYGTIGINAWTGVGYLTPRATWGAFPGHTLDDIRSGIGVVHNALLLARPERTVVTGPFRPLRRSLLHGEPSISPTPPWFVDNRTAHITGRRLTAFSARPRWRSLPAIFAAAIRG